MSLLTSFFNLIKPQKTDPQAISQINEDLDIIDTEMHRPPLTVNEVEPDPTTRDLYLEEVPLATNLSSEIAQINNGTFIERTTGGDASVDDGSAMMVSIKGNMVHTGYVAESLNMTVNAVERTAEEGEEVPEAITATIDRDVFVAYVQVSGTTTLIYSNAWSADPALYGVTVTGTPVAGDQIVIVYVKEERGTITVANPSSFKSTGWNLYNNSVGYAKVIKYSDNYGYKIGGTFTAVEFSDTVAGTRTTITPVDGYFSISGNGYVFVTGGDDTTYIYATWSDWTDTYDGDFEAYTVSTIDLSGVMALFPYGLMAIGNVHDEINLNAQVAVNRIERLAYTAENLETVVASGRAYDADTNYIYAVMATPVTTSITLGGTYDVSDHGIEYFIGTTIGVIVETLYGENLKDKLRTDVLTKSQDLVNNLTTNDSSKVLSAAQGYALNNNIAKLTAKSTGNCTLGTNVTATMARCYTIGTLGFITINNLRTTVASSTWETVLTLPSGVVPADDSIYGYIVKDVSGQTVFSVAEARMDSNGLQIFAPQTNTSYWGTIVFPVDI